MSSIDQQTPVTPPTFNVGGQAPTTSLIRMSGVAFTHRELEKGEEVHLQVSDSEGNVVADAYGRVEGVTFKDRYDKKTGALDSTERVHSMKVT